jgi:hypothetical protein
LVLNFFAPDYYSSIKQYQEYMVQNKSLGDPLKQTYRNLALGNDDFIQKIKAIIENQKNSREIPITNSTNSYHP